MHVDTLIHARWVLPIRPAGTVLENHSVAIKAGRIAAIVPSAQARSQFTAAETVDLPGSALMPGLVNLHTHAAMNLLRGLGADLPLQRWLGEKIWPAEGRLMSPEFVRDGTLLSAAEMLRGGTTCCSDMYFFPAEAARALRSMGMRCAVGAFVIGFPSAYAKTDDEYFARGRELAEEFAGDPLATVTIAPHAPYTVSDASLARVRDISDKTGMRIHMHVSETATETAQSLERFGMRPIERLRRLGLVNERLISVHTVDISPEEQDLYAASGVTVAHCPSSNLKLASGFCPVESLRSRGVRIGIGTDGAASNDKIDMFAETRLAAILAKAVSGRADALPASAALEAATLGGATALGLEKEIGSIEAGKAADLISVDFEQIGTLPVTDALAQSVYSADRCQVSNVWISGAPVVKTQRFVHFKPQEVESTAKSICKAWQNMIVG